MKRLFLSRNSTVVAYPNGQASVHGIRGDMSRIGRSAGLCEWRVGFEESEGIILEPCQTNPRSLKAKAGIHEGKLKSPWPLRRPQAGCLVNTCEY